MAIRAYNPGKTVLMPGQWICAKSSLLDQRCGEPRQVVSATKDRVRWNYRKGEGSCMKKEIVFVADTEEEANQMFALEQRRAKAIGEERRRLMAEFDAEAGKMLAKEGA